MSATNNPDRSEENIGSDDDYERWESGKTLPSDFMVSDNDPGKPGIRAALAVESIAHGLNRVEGALYQTGRLTFAGYPVRGMVSCILLQLVVYALLSVMVLLRKPCQENYWGVYDHNYDAFRYLWRPGTSLGRF